MKIFLFFVMLMWGGMATAQTALVTDAARVNMRSGKAENYRLIRVLPPSTEVQVIEIDQDYAKVKAADGETGWVLLKLLTIRKTDAENATQNQAALEASQKELVTARVELANLQREMEQTHNQPGASAPISFLLLLAFGAFAGGVVIGVLALRAYYRKRLHGLRI
ncbi:TIGR04211 family SH3 domain-containing protein [Sulfuricella sp.]|uniref:TIGR04211 family SH3 domain-containing protein n=1 Tax=Sulfuricella sp. TaxID=2099377 RepID=UPI002C191B24|nr:TIGR04211 family SH3 domain-containing protein [Sulfuricella sp.]HUX65468.1 TIGR04211 family SH3 domain-containing protein [Sulfuricella sp.]